VTVAQARLTTDNAVTEIDRLITTAWHQKLPVYMEVPSDIGYLDIEVPTAPLVLAEPPSDPERLRSCAAAITDRMSQAKSPAILVDLDADRYGAAGEIMRLAEKTQVPVAVAPTAKAVIDETFPHYLGLYNGRASQPNVQEAIENSDCLLSVGYRPIDLTTGDFTGSLPADTIHLRGHSVDVGDDNYQAVTLTEVLSSVADAVPRVTNRATRHFAPAAAMGNHADGSAKLTQAAYWQAIQGYIRSGDVLVAEDGTSYASAGLQLPPNCTFVSQVIWGSIGYSVGSLLGTLTAAPDRRHLLFVGDGSFQLTAQEVSTMLRHDYKPVIFLINNRGYTIERCWLGKTSHFNDVADWSYADLPKVFRRDTNARSFVVKTLADLEKALSAPNDSLIFIESIMDPFDAPTAVIKQRQQRGRHRLRASRPAAPRQHADPASHMT
jgi:indolepyruvate decarboxylase